jgi:DNA-binding NarL/FixJ family response regulator
MPSKQTRILLADDHGVVRNGFRALLAAQWDMEVIVKPSNWPKSSHQMWS